MLGRQHLVITLATVTGLIIPLYYFSPVLSILALFGAALGTLIPDIDGNDALIFHSRIIRVETGYTQFLNIFPGLLFPIVGYITKYTIYFPSVLLFKLLLPNHYRPEYGHRKYMHSILGLFTTTLITGIYIASVLSILQPFGISAILGLTAFLTGYFFGGLLHLVEDSCTKTGVMFFYPFSNLKIHGKIVTGKDKVKPHLMTLAMAATAFAALYLTYKVGSIKSMETVLGLNLVFWSLFLGLIAEIELSN